MGEIRLDVVATGFDFPTSVVLDDQGVVYVAESGLPFAGAQPGGRVWRVGADGDRELMIGGLRPPVNGIAAYGGDLYLSEGGHPQRISRLDQSGALSTVLEGLPGPGNYQLNMVAIGPEGKLYFSQGAMTNTGIVGLDAYELGWLGRLPHAHDVPGYDIVLAESSVETLDPLAETHGARTTTGAFCPFGESAPAGRRLVGQVPATAAIMRCNPDGSDLDLVAWGLRNAYGLRFLPDGRLLAVDQGPDDRGSRPVGNAPDLLFEVRRGAWYGWPDFLGGDPVTDPAYTPTRGPAPRFVLANHAELPPPEPALVRFPPHTAAVKLDVAPEATPWPGHLVVALFGDEAPMTAPSGPRVGRSVVRVDPSDWSMHPLLRGPLRRPIDVCFDATGSLYVLDFGEFEMSERGVEAQPGTGVLVRAELG
ncbi:MAG: PQQ-dependent sugar dehydrogenase [Actinobacteria bacterium]|nr:PQQ-dependent sugar dehydrogenase [Actinomycetota bacterium]